MSGRPLSAHRALAVGAFLAAVAGCRSGTEPGPVLVRLRNTSPVAFTAVAVSFPRGERATADALPAGATTGYTAVRRAYGYAYVEATVGGECRRIQPIDFVGATPLASGRYTYELTTDAAGRGLDMTFRADGRF